MTTSLHLRTSTAHIGRIALPTTSSKRGASLRLRLRLGTGLSLVLGIVALTSPAASTQYSHQNSAAGVCDQSFTRTTTPNQSVNVLGYPNSLLTPSGVLFVPVPGSGFAVFNPGQFTTVVSGGVTYYSPTVPYTTNPYVSTVPVTELSTLNPPGAACGLIADSAAAAATMAPAAADAMNRGFDAHATEYRIQIQAAQAAGLPAFTQFAPLGTEVPTVFTADRSARTGYVPMAAPQPMRQTIKPSLWIRTFGEVMYRDGPGNIPGFVGPALGLGGGIGAGGFLADQERRLSTFGFQGGVDLTLSGIASNKDGVVIGALGGYLQSHLTMRNSATAIDLRGPVAGVFGSYLNGPYFADLMFRGDILRMDYNDTFTAQSIDVRNYNVIFNTGFKVNLGGSNAYIEPVTGFEYTRTTYSGPILGPGYFFQLQDGDTFRARVGARFGTSFTMNNVRIEPSVLVNGWNAVKQDNNTLFTSAATGSLFLSDRRDNLYAEVSPSINFMTQAGWSGFTRAEFRFGDHFTSYGGRIGIRYTW